MDIHYVAKGENAPEGADKVTINRLPSGKAGFMGSVQTGSVTNHFIHANDFDSPEAAERAALEIAEERGATLIYVERPDA